MDKRRAMMEEYRRYRETAQQIYQEQKSIRLELRGGATSFTASSLHMLPSTRLSWYSRKSLTFFFFLCVLGVDSDELDSNVDDWEEETIEFFINEEIIPLGDL